MIITWFFRAPYMCMWFAVFRRKRTKSQNLVCTHIASDSIQWARTPTISFVNEHQKSRFYCEEFPCVGRVVANRQVAIACAGEVRQRGVDGGKEPQLCGSISNLQSGLAPTQAGARTQERGLGLLIANRSYIRYWYNCHTLLPSQSFSV